MTRRTGSDQVAQTGPGSRRCQSGDCLTCREIEVLLLLAADMRTAEIARRLGVSTRTVDHHVATMLRRSGAESRGGLIARCYASGILRSKTWPPEWSGYRCLRVGTLSPCGTPE